MPYSLFQGRSLQRRDIHRPKIDLASYFAKALALEISVLPFQLKKLEAEYDFSHTILVQSHYNTVWISVLTITLFVNNKSDF